MREGRPALHPSLSSSPSFCSLPIPNLSAAAVSLSWLAAEGGARGGHVGVISPQQMTAFFGGGSAPAAPWWLITPAHQRADRVPDPGQTLCMLDISHAAQRSFLPYKAKGATFCSKITCTYFLSLCKILPGGFLYSGLTNKLIF